MATPIGAQTLEDDLRGAPPSDLIALAKSRGDAARGAVVFHQPAMACRTCHATGAGPTPSLGPDLAALDETVTDESLVESILAPSKVVRKGYESVTITTTDGKSLTALLVERSPQRVVVRELSRGGETTTIAADDIEEVKTNTTSLMPVGQVNQLNSRQQFLDLVRYLLEIRDGGAVRAKQLQPSAALLTFTIPEYERRIDHAGLIADWSDESFRRGEAIYHRVCVNCHGTKEEPGSLPSSLRFAEGTFKNGSDPLSMYRTLTHGFGLMAPQTWMVPSQKYDVVHYIREAYLKRDNASQYVTADDAYRARLPVGDTRGPSPSPIEPWSAMDYGPTLAHTFEIPGLKHNLAYKGIAVRLDTGAGGVSRGRHWAIFDTDTLRMAVAWNGSGEAQSNFLDWRGIQFNGAHGVHPRIVGRTAFTNSTGPGWANPADGSFRDDLRTRGRDGRHYGPLPRGWGRFKGLYHHGQEVVLSYSIGGTDALESPGVLSREDPTAAPLILRTFHIGGRDRELLLQVAEHSSPEAHATIISRDGRSVARFGLPAADTTKKDVWPVAFDGNTWLEVADASDFDLTSKDFSITARIKTRADGTIWSLCQAGPTWTPDGQTFFIRDGRLAFDIGWVGAVAGRTKVDDDRWHDVVMTWEHATHNVRLYVDGTLDGDGALAAKAPLTESIVRIGFTTPDFPRPTTFLRGAVDDVRFYQRRLTQGLAEVGTLPTEDPALTARWLPGDAKGTAVVDCSGHKHDANVRRGTVSATVSGPLFAGFAPASTPVSWTSMEGRLVLRIPAGDQPLSFTVWHPSDPSVEHPVEGEAPAIPGADRDLTALTHGGPSRWPQELRTQAILGADSGPFAVDTLTVPETNPWLAQTRLTGLDFFADGRIAVCTWDGDVWIVTPAESDQGLTLTWRRIASGLFQPLGLKIVDGRIHLTCRDQLAVLHDLNDDSEIDFYECLNNDHQVTEHFHEFAMGLQTDAEGNFYYAKSGCHGKAAVVPHHGTLLKVNKDGSKTDILATGFRAANGVCLNPDGSFVVTDQEGFWNPKNRINWVTVPKSGRPNFYGNMLGYHDVTDSSDAAMAQPLCWIVNEFDRSPAELLWVESERWGTLNRSLLNLSYGYGKVFLVLHEKVGQAMQGGMIELPIPTFPTGVMRGRFHPGDQQLYLCGMFAWAGNATHPGGFYRLRATGRPIHVPLGLHAKRTGLTLEFAEPLDPASVKTMNVQVRTWSLKRTAEYGSQRYDEKTLTVRDVTLSGDGRSLTLDVTDLRPTWCMEIGYSFRAADGSPVQGTLHNTIHELGNGLPHGPTPQ